MRAIVCELCGGNELKKENGVFVCRHCGTQYSLEEAKKLFVEIDGPVEVKGTVKIDRSNSRRASIESDLIKFDLIIDGVNQGDYGWTESFILDDGPHNIYCAVGEEQSNIVSIEPGNTQVSLKLVDKGFIFSKLVLSVQYE